MWIRSGRRHCVPIKRFPWLDSNGCAALMTSRDNRIRILGTGVAESIMDDMAEAERRIASLHRDLRDSSMADLKELVTAELESENLSISENSNRIRKLVLIAMDANGVFDQDKLDARLEVKAGVGGEEALKWAQEIFSMYSQVSARMGWDFSVEEEGDVMKAVVSSRGDQGPYGYLKYESGVHRVQRVPFNSDRMQTSAAGVIVVPKIEVPSVTVRDSDLKISISKKSSGAGGQSVNAAYQQVRMTHIPSGYTVVVNESHAQQENREIALERIKARVQQMGEEKALAAMAKSRKGQVRTADRSEKVRSYNFQRGEVNDHRLSAKEGGVVKESCEEFMTDCSNLVKIWERLKDRAEDEMINAYICAK